MCSTPKLKKTKQSKSYQGALSVEMDQSSYARMIRQANDAYEKRHPDSVDKPVIIRNKKLKSQTISKPLSYWFTQASMTELRQLISRRITIN